VDILLWRWEQIKVGGREDAPLLRQLLLEAGHSDVDLKRVLWELSHEAHAQMDIVEDQEELADIGELGLQEAVAALKDGDSNWASQIIEAIILHTGLFLECEPGVLSLPHRSFQEYLAGVHLAAQANFATLQAQPGRTGFDCRCLPGG
jgi:hypothetical protein